MAKRDWLLVGNHIEWTNFSIICDRFNREGIDKNQSHDLLVLELCFTHLVTIFSRFRDVGNFD